MAAVSVMLLSVLLSLYLRRLANPNRSPLPQRDAARVSILLGFSLTAVVIIVLFGLHNLFELQAYLSWKLLGIALLANMVVVFGLAEITGNPILDSVILAGTIVLLALCMVAGICPVLGSLYYDHVLAWIAVSLTVAFLIRVILWINY